jgi:predicted phosphodiesterase
MNRDRIFFLGDIHDNFKLVSHYVNLYGITNADIIQVGDFGVGFRPFDTELKNLTGVNEELVKANVHLWAIRGNHDFKRYFDNDPFGLTNIHLVSDYTILELVGKRILCIGGAISVDRVPRMTKLQYNGFNVEPTIGKESWWPDEVFELKEDILLGVENIDIVVTHTAPDFCFPTNQLGFGPFVDEMAEGDQYLKLELTHERKQMTRVFEILKETGKNRITNHFYGHFHKDRSYDFDNIDHRLLGVGTLYELDERINNSYI